MEAIYPPQCALCSRIGEPPICTMCAADFKPSDSQAGRWSISDALDESWAMYSFEGRAAQAVKRLKYSRATSLAKPMAERLAARFSELGDICDFITPVPIHWTRRCWRGFNQAELLANALPGEKLALSTLLRIRPTRPQVELSREERLRSLHGAFSADPSAAGHRILLIDDVITTGGTALACASALKHAGAAWVGILAFCGERSPDPTVRMD